MCDEKTVRDSERALAASGRWSRRAFGRMAGAVSLAAMLPRAAHALDITQVDVSITTPDGVADCHFAHPVEGAHAGVIVWPDILGLRPAFRMMGERLAESGYAVLTVNPFYRQVAAPVVTEGASFQDHAVREVVIPLARALTAETNRIDARAFVEWLDVQSAVDTSRKIGTTGYCMGGRMVMRTAATMPERVGAGASFHGGGLVTEGSDSPHLLIPEMRASFLIAIAENDDQQEPEAKTVLADTFDANKLAAEIEVYEGALHGWCPPDSAVYNETQAERAWQRLLALFDGALA